MATADQAYQAAWDYLDGKTGEEHEEAEYPIMAAKADSRLTLPIEKNSERKVVKKTCGGTSTALVVAADTTMLSQEREREQKEAGKCWRYGASDHLTKDCSSIDCCCSHCGKKGHTEARCWTLHPEFKPLRRLKQLAGGRRQPRKGTSGDE